MEKRLQRRILIVDDDAAVATMLARALARRGYAIDATASPDEALQKAEAVSYDAALVDLVMPGRDGGSLAEALRGRIPGLRVALLTGYSNSPLIESARRARLRVFLKPVEIQAVVDFLEQKEES
jgi:ActR/RegA family two-component response regulator